MKTFQIPVTLLSSLPTIVPTQATRAPMISLYTLTAVIVSFLLRGIERDVEFPKSNFFRNPTADESVLVCDFSSSAAISSEMEKSGTICSAPLLFSREKTDL